MENTILVRARQTVREHEVPGAHVWSPSLERGYDFEAASCDECDRAREIIERYEQERQRQRNWRAAHARS